MKIRILFLLCRVQSDNHDDTLALISPDGSVYWTFQTYYSTSCKINARFFPFDSQNCTLTFGSWTYEKPKLDFQIGRVNPSSLSDELYTNNGIWSLRTEVVRYEKSYPDYPAPYTLIHISLILTRRPLYYILVIGVPCTLLSLINLMVFLLPTESGEKVSLAITNFLALVLVQQLVGEFIPPADDKFPVVLSEYNRSITAYHDLIVYLY